MQKLVAFQIHRNLKKVIIYAKKADKKKNLMQPFTVSSPFGY